MSATNTSEQSIFLAALELGSAQERAAYLHGACGDDRPLREAVESLLAAHEREGNVLDSSPIPAVAESKATLEHIGLFEGPGTIVGHYKLLQQIGEGGMGTVYMAQQTEPVKRIVAVKIIKAGMDSKQVIARFEAERQALALMDHPNIAKVLDAGTTGYLAPALAEGEGPTPALAEGESPTPAKAGANLGLGRPYFVMELVKGVPLTKYCDEHQLTPRQRLELFVPVCQALQHAHQKGIIHRDLKPSNILVAQYDGKPVPKVIDFGVAKAAGQSLTDKTLVTGFGNIVGTLEYMSPEQAEFNQLDIDTRSDIYSLGVLLYELLTGSTPFTKKGLEKAGMLEMLRLIREQEPSKPSTKLSTAEGLPTLAANRGTEPAKLTKLVRGELDWIVMKALEKDRSRRYETANGFAMDVQRYLADEAVQACPPSFGYRLRKYARRNKVPAFVSALVLLTLIVGIVGIGWQSLRANQERTTAIEERNAKQLALERSQLLLAEFAFDKGQLLGERGDADLALLWLARSLTMVPPDATTLQSAIRINLHAWQCQVNSVRMMLTHEMPARAVAFAPDDRCVTASVGPNEVTVRRWELDTGRASEPSTFRTPKEARMPPAFSPKTDRLLISYENDVDGSIQMMELATGKSVWKNQNPQDSRPVLAVFSPDGKTVLVGYCVGEEETQAAKGIAQLLDASTGKSIGRALVHDRPVFAAAFFPDGKSFVTENGLWADGTEKVQAQFRNLDGTPFRAPLDHPCMAQSVAVSPDGTLLLTGHADRKARLWNLAASREPKVLPHDAPVLTVAFSPNGKSMLTGSADGTVRLWDLSGRLLRQPLRHGHEVNVALFKPNGKTILVGVDEEYRTRLWDLADTQLDGQSELPESINFPLAFSSDRKTILSLETAKIVRLRDAATDQPIGRPLIHPHPVLIEGVSAFPGQRNACSADRRRAITLDEENVLRLWDTDTGNIRKVLEPFSGQKQPKFFAAAFSPDSKVVVTSIFHGKAHLWDAFDGKLLGPVEHEYAGPIFNAAFSPDGNYLVTVSADRAARFWDPPTREPLGPSLLHPSTAFTLAFNPDGKTIATGGANTEVQIWDVVTRKPLLRLYGHQGGVNSLAYSQDGRFILTGSQDQTARLWDAVSGKPIGMPMRHSAPVARVAFGLDGKTVLTATDDKVARSWPVPSALSGTADDLELWVQVVTGMELESDGGLRILNAIEWQHRGKLLRVSKRYAKQLTRSPND